MLWALKLRRLAKRLPETKKACSQGIHCPQAAASEHRFNKRASLFETVCNGVCNRIFARHTEDSYGLAPACFRVIRSYITDIKQPILTTGKAANTKHCLFFAKLKRFPGRTFCNAASKNSLSERRAGGINQPCLAKTGAKSDTHHAAGALNIRQLFKICAEITGKINSSVTVPGQHQPFTGGALDHIDRINRSTPGLRLFAQAASFLQS